MGQSLWSAAEIARVERLCAVLTGDAAAAPDLAQETLLQAWRIRDRVTDPSGASAWLDAVARHVCRRWSRTRGRSRELPVDVPPVEDVAEVLEHVELVELLDRALALLDEPVRDALVQRYVEERGTEEIGRALGVSADAVAMRLVRGRSRLRELLETDLADEPLARTWRQRYGVAWRPTRIACTDCGTTTLDWRRDHVGGTVELRCRTCTPADVSSSFRLDNPAYSSLREAQRPSTVLGRVDAWVASWWPTALAGPAPCTRCGQPVRATAYRRDEPADDRTRRGWAASCAACGEGVSISWGGLALSLSGGRTGGRRMRALPSRAVTVDGRAAVVVAYADAAGGDGVEAVFDDVSARLVAPR